jgi:fructokinase
LLEALPACSKFYDLNLRPGYDSAELVNELLDHADVVKLNEEELDAVHKFADLPPTKESFCREGSKRYGWRAVCITLGARGCAMLCGDEYIEAEGHAIDVADTVGAGDAFAAAFLHGLISEWPVKSIAAFANRLGALVASRHSAIPDWTVNEAVEL